MRNISLQPFACAGLGVLVACGTASQADSDSGSGLTTITSTLSGTDSSAGATGPILDVPLGPEVGMTEPEPEECGSFSQEAVNTLQPADIIIVVDNSGSMGEEAADVQANVNSFSQQITASGVDARVVLISSYPSDGNGICVDPPLGNGGCPDADTNPPLFTHIDDRVGSNDALELLIGQHASWAGVVRPDSDLHLVIVTDDESNMDAMTFDAQFQALDAGYAGYKLHGIVSVQNCPEAAQIGDIYIELADLTGGVIGDLCLQDFQPVFDSLATEVISGSVLTCEWAVPMPAEGEEFDPDKVNVEFDDGSGTILEIGRVDDAAGCAAVQDGWYYDDPVDPTLILACPQTCERMQGAMMASISIKLGCATVGATPG